MPEQAQQVVPDSGVARGGDFVHLHLHTEYSLLDGGNRMDRLIARVKELGMSAVAVTDHGNLFGAVSFHQHAKAAGVKPIFGVEAYVAPGDRRSREYTGVVDGGYHLVLLAENFEGWKNLVTLCSEAYLTGFYFKPRMDREILGAHSRGLIAISGHLGSELAHHLVEYEKTRDEAHFERARAAAAWHAETFRASDAGPGFYVELQCHVDEQNVINPHLIRLAKEMGLPLVATNDAHFLREQDHDAHDTLICISTGKAKSDTNRMRYPTQVYVKSPRQMRELFEQYGDEGREACDNTLRIAERCNVDLPIGENHAPLVRVGIPEEADLPRPDDPRFGGDLTAWHSAYSASFGVLPLQTTEGIDLDAVQAECDRALRMLCEAGLVWRYGAGRRQDEQIRARLERELAILSEKRISAYFLIVWDFVNWGRQRGIPALARGSGVGTMVGYVLGLSNACPVGYGLLFERFTDPDRSEYPDIDIDLCQDGRSEVIDYVRRKYGHVAQIITFGTLKARAAVRDVGRVLEMPLAEVDRLAKLIPEQLGVTLDTALEQEPDLRALYEQRDDVRRLIDNARTIEGQARHSSVHAAGVIVATRPLHEVVPLYRQAGAAEQEIVTQWDGPTCEKMGLLKMDFLGLRTLSVIERARRLVREAIPEHAVWEAVGRSPDDGGPHPLDLERLAYDDQRVFDLFRRGDTAGVFQFESGGMRRLLIEMRPDRLEDLIAANALFRPGPMDLIPDYNRRKHGHDRVPSVHPIVDKHTQETYGVMVYQEQVMQIVHELGGIPLRAAYTLIKAISKKKEKVINAERENFLRGAQSRGLDRSAAEELFEMILKFAGYGFNKSHSTGYAIVAYQTAYLKTYFPNQYMAAFLTFESKAQKVADWIPYLEDCKRVLFTDGRTGVRVLPPDINLSSADFSVVFEDGEPRDALHGHVRFGLKAIKGVGEKAIETIVRERDGADAATAANEGVVEEVPCADSPAGYRPFRSLFDFCERVPPGALNKATLESLVKCGAFDSVHGRECRASMCATVESAISHAQRIARDKAAGQAILFGAPEPCGDDEADADATLARAEPWSEIDTLTHEKEALGFYISSHPLEKWAPWSNLFATASARAVREMPHDKRVVLPVLVQSVRLRVTRSGRSAGQKMAIVTFEDLTGTAEGVFFSECYAQFAHLLVDDTALFLLGRVDRSRGEAQIVADRVVPIDGVPLQPGRVCLHLSSTAMNGSADSAVQTCAEILRGSGSTNGGARRNGADEPAPAFPLDVVVQTEHGVVVLETDRSLRIRPTFDLAKRLDDLLGPGALRVVNGVAVEATTQSNGRGGARRVSWPRGRQPTPA